MEDLDEAKKQRMKLDRESEELRKKLQLPTMKKIETVLSADTIEMPYTASAQFECKEQYNKKKVKK